MSLPPKLNGALFLFIEMVKKGGGSASLGPAQIFWSTFCPKIKKNIFEEKILHFEKNAPLMPKLEGGGGQNLGNAWI